MNLYIQGSSFSNNLDSLSSCDGFFIKAQTSTKGQSDTDSLIERADQSLPNFSVTTMSSTSLLDPERAKDITPPKVREHKASEEVKKQVEFEINKEIVEGFWKMLSGIAAIVALVAIAVILL